MASPTAMNSQVTDGVTQANVEVVGDSPAMSLGNLYIVNSHALGNAAHNAASNQEQVNVTAQAATTQGVALLISLDTAAAGSATHKILK